jgi:glucokinase
MKPSYDASSIPLLGLEIGESGTHLATYLETAAGPRRQRRRLSAPPSPQEALSLIQDLCVRTIYDLSPEEPTQDSSLPPLRLGVAFWGQLDRDKQTVLMLRQNQRWSGFPLADALAALTTGEPRTRVTLETAINAAAWCEAAGSGGPGDEGSSLRVSASSSGGTLLYIYLEREVSAAIVQDGQLLIRHSDSEERFGHTTVAADGPRCQCGGFGHLNPLASAQALVRRMIGRASDHDQSLDAILRISGGRAEALTAPQVIELATNGDAIATDILSVAQDALSLAIANAILLLFPDEIVIGGPLTPAGEAFLQPLRARLALLLENNAPLPDLHMGRFEPFGSLKGAYALARDR